MSTKVPSIPAPTSANLLQVAQAVKNLIDVREGSIGNPLDANVTFRDLVDAGALFIRPGWNGGGAGIPVMPPWVDPDGYDPTQDFTVPPQPANFTATGLFAVVQLQWDRPTYRNHSYTEIWRSETNVIGNAVRVATTDVSIYADSIGTSATRYYWVRFVSQADVKGPYNAVDGVSATTATDPELVLASLSGQIRESHLYQDLASRIDLIDASALLNGSVNQRILTETNARTQQILAESIARSTAISAETAARTQQIYDESQARAAAINAEASARASAILAEAQQRQAAITSEATTRQSADESLSSQITTLSASLTNQNNTLTAAIQSESIARSDAISAEASSRSTLATQLRGSYSGNDAGQVTSGLIYSERVSRVSADSALQTQINTLVAASSGDFQDLFAAITEEQTARIDGDSVNASNTSLLTSRLDNLRDASGNVTGKSLEATIIDNKSAQVSGDQALSTQVSLLTSTVNNNYTALNSAITSEASTRASAISAEASSRESLSTQLRGSYSGTDVNQVTAGLIFSERTSRVAADQSLQTQINVLTASSSGDLQELIASVQEEQTARIQGDAAEAAQRQTLASQVRGGYEGSDLSMVTSGLIFQERQARTTAVSSLATEVSLLSATVSTKTKVYYQSTAPQDSPVGTLVVGDLWIDTDVTYYDDYNAGDYVIRSNRQYRWDGAAWQEAIDYGFADWFSAINTEKTARVDGDSALATQITSLTSLFNGNTAAIQQEATTRANADSSLSTSITTLSSQVNNATTGLPATRSLLINDYYTKTAADSAIASATSTLVSTTALNTALSNYTTTALLQTNYYTKTQTDSAISSATTTLQSTVNNQLTGYATTAALQTEAETRASVDGGLLAKYTVKTDLAGRVAGFGLASETNTAGVNTSSFAIIADRFSISAPNDYTQEATPTSGVTAGKVWYKPSTNQTFRYDGANWVAFNPIVPFAIQTTPTTIGGVTVPAGVYMDAAFIKNGTITNVKIANAAIDNAKIANLDAAKINAGFLSADRIQAGALDAKIANIDAAVITSGTINTARIGDATIGFAKIANDIESSDYVAGSAGWRIDKTGQMEMNNAVFRGSLAAASGTFIGSMTAGSININNKFTVDASGNTAIRSGTSGARMEIANNVIKVFDASGVLRVQIGDLAA